MNLLPTQLVTAMAAVDERATSSRLERALGTINDRLGILMRDTEGAITRHHISGLFAGLFDERDPLSAIFAGLSAMPETNVGYKSMRPEAGQQATLAPTHLNALAKLLRTLLLSHDAVGCGYTVDKIAVIVRFDNQLSVTTGGGFGDGKELSEFLAVSSEAAMAAHANDVAEETAEAELKAAAEAAGKPEPNAPGNTPESTS